MSKLIRELNCTTAQEENRIVVQIQAMSADNEIAFVNLTFDNPDAKDDLLASRILVAIRELNEQIRKDWSPNKLLTE